MTDYKLVLTTAGSQEEARTIARTLVERRLAACVNIVPQIESIYRWKDAVEETPECLLLIKTSLGALDRVRHAIRELHSYEVPEFICLAIEDGSPGYLDWIAGSVR